LEEAWAWVVFDVLLSLGKVPSACRMPTDTTLVKSSLA
jgi:hypothetical protein